MCASRASSSARNNAFSSEADKTREVVAAEGGRGEGLDPLGLRPDDGDLSGVLGPKPPSLGKV